MIQSFRVYFVVAVFALLVAAWPAVRSFADEAKTASPALESAQPKDDAQGPAQPTDPQGQDNK